MDLTNVTMLDSASERTQQFDVRYSEAQGKFEVSDDIWVQLGMESHAWNIGVSQDGHVLIFVVEDGEGIVLNRRQPSEDSTRDQYGKGKMFTSSRLRRYLDEAGYEGINTFELSEIETDMFNGVYEITSDVTEETETQDDTPVFV